MAPRVIFQIDAFISLNTMVVVFCSGVEMQCIGYFKLLFYLLRMPLSTEVQQAALEVISVVTTNQECVNDIAASEVLAGLLLVIPSLPKSTQLILETLYALISNTKIVKEVMVKGKQPLQHSIRLCFVIYRHIIYQLNNVSLIDRKSVV